MVSVSPAQNSGLSASSIGGARKLTPEQQKQVEDLKRTDAEVRLHEQAHKAAGGPYASGPTYEYATGPDGRRYAVGGEVKIDASPVRNNPEATIRKADVVKRAALAPGEPSSQDRVVAAQADAIKAQAQAELREKRQQESKDEEGGGAGGVPGGLLDATTARTAQSTDRQATDSSGDGGSRKAGNLGGRVTAAYGRAAAVSFAPAPSLLAIVA